MMIKHTYRSMIICIGVMLVLTVMRFARFSYKPLPTVIRLAPSADASDADIVVSEAVGERIAADEEAKAIADAAEAEQIKVEEEARVKAEEEVTRLHSEEEARVVAEVAMAAAIEAEKIKVDEDARVKVELARLQAEEEARIVAEEEAKSFAAAAEAERMKVEEEVRVKAEEEATRLQAVEEAKAKEGVDETGEMRVREEAKSVAREAPKLKTINVHVYGGSITKGAGLGLGYGRMTRYSALLQSMLQHYDDTVDVVVSNFGIAAAGPEYWNLCGIGVADIIISEFRINEWSRIKLRKWYELAISHCTHLVVLDLWSWLTPPTGGKSATMAALPHIGNISSVSLDLIELDTWQELVPRYFNYTGVYTIPQQCYDSIHQKSENETSIIKWCRRAHAGNMQHGTELYHEHVAKTMYTHLVDIGLLYRLKEDTPIDNTAKDTMCFSQWNLINGVNDGKVGYWNQTIIHNKGFSIHNLHPSTADSGFLGKITLNTNSTSAQLQLNCPPPYNITAKVGYIAHSDEEESGIIRINGSQMLTKLENENRPHVRIRQFASSLTLPIYVSVDELPIGQYIEFTGLICFSH